MAMPTGKEIYERNMARRKAKEQTQNTANNIKNTTNAVNSSASSIYNNIKSNTNTANMQNWQNKVSDLYDTISSRKFTYNQADDPLYNQYAQMYQQNAQLAMQDTVGQVSALTGGYGNSYAQTAGQAMYTQNMNQLNDKALELQQLAQNQYNAETENLNNLYGMAADQYAQAYQENRDAVSDSQWSQEFAYQQSRDAISDDQWSQEFNYQQSRDAVSDTQWQKEFDEKQRQYDASMALDYLQSGYNADGSVNENSYTYKNYALDKDAADLNWIKSGYNKDGTINENSQWAKEFAYQKERDAASDAQFAKQLAVDYAKIRQDYTLNGYTYNGASGQYEYSGTAEDVRKNEENKQKWAEMGYTWSDLAGEYQHSYNNLTSEQQKTITKKVSDICKKIDDKKTTAEDKEKIKTNLMNYLDSIAGTMITDEEAATIVRKYFPSTTTTK